MLDKELRGQDYNKTEHRRHLVSMLNARSDGAIERKHQNISAILIELGFPYIAGYKPLGNYQQLLHDVVSHRLQEDRNLTDFVRNQVDQPAKIPGTDNILSALVKPPSMIPLKDHDVVTRVRETSPQFSVDYLAKEARNRSLGNAGEKFVLFYEKARLMRAAKEKLAAKVEHVAVTQGDGAGFDILSFETTGQERFIEVKTTAYGPLTPFFVTKKEVDVSLLTSPRYYLYRAFDFRRQAKLFTKQGPLDRSFKLNPTQYLASLI
jgi:hypothetical protein